MTVMMRFVGGPWNGREKNRRDVYIDLSNGRVIVREAYATLPDFRGIARVVEPPTSVEPKFIQTEYARWHDGTWRVKAIDGREYDAPPEEG